MSKLAMSFYSACVCLAILTLGAFGQVVTTEPAKPKWGDTLKITYNPQSPGAAFTLDQEVRLTVYQAITGTDEPRTQTVTMTRSGTVLTCEIKVEADVSNIQLSFFRPPEKYDSKARQMLMVYRSDGQPARGAWLTQAMSSNYREAVENELALYPDNYGAYVVKWRAASFIEREKVREIIEADIKEVGQKITGEPLAWLRALSFGYLTLNQEARSREALRKMFAREPDSPLTRSALYDYWYQAISQRLTGEGPNEVNGMFFTLMKRNPAGRFARENIGNFAWYKETPLDVTEAVCRKWIEDQPENPEPYFHLATALHRQEQKPEQIAPLIDKAIDLYVRGKARGSEVSVYLPLAFGVSAETAFKQQRYVNAITAAKAAQSFNTENAFGAYLLEAHVWDKLGNAGYAEKAYRVAWNLGSKEAEDGLKAIYRKDKGNLEGFEAWLNKKDAAKTAGRAEAKRAFPGFSVTSLDGKKYDLTTLRGGIVALNFWFIGCGPCKAEMSDLNKLVKDYEGKEVTFLAITPDDAESLKAFLKENTFSYEIVPDTQSIIDKLEITAFPAHYVINQQGEVELTLRGGGEGNVAQVRNVIARLVAASKEAK
jgi:peroxiredoxin